MTYRADLGPGMARIGFTPGPPHVLCDAPGCTARLDASPTRGGMPAWLRNGRPPKGWRTVRRVVDDMVYRRDFCKTHRDLADKESHDGK